MQRNPPSIVIREIETILEMREVEALQKEVWGVEDREIFPTMALIPLREVGSILIGAFAGARMAGFVFGFPGHEDGRLTLHSDMLAVRPEYRALGLGYRLKLAQGERALQRGIDTITWTFDPLQALNARLNFGKLGVTANRYLVNYYGETTSFLHRTGTDRLWVTWQLNSRRVADRIRAGGTAEPEFWRDSVAILGIDEHSEPIVRADYELGAAPVAIEIPSDINQLQKENAEFASHWRIASRQAFTKTIDAGLTVCEFEIFDRGSDKVGRYLLK